MIWANVAALSTIAVATTDAFWVGAAIAFAGVLVSVFVVRVRDLRPLEKGATP